MQLERLEPGERHRDDLEASAHVVAELSSVRRRRPRAIRRRPRTWRRCPNTPRGPTAFGTNYKAFYWQSPEGLNTWAYRYVDKWMSEDQLDKNPPRAARAYALVSAVQFDAFIASQDGKFTYWYIRPSQLDPTIAPVFPVPNHPSYPSNHSTFSHARSEILAYLFPTRADVARALGEGER